MRNKPTKFSFAQCSTNISYRANYDPGGFTWGTIRAANYYEKGMASTRAVSFTSDCVKLWANV